MAVCTKPYSNCGPIVQTAVALPCGSIAMSGSAAYPLMSESATGWLQAPPAGRVAARTTSFDPFPNPSQTTAASPSGLTTTFGDSGCSPACDSWTGALQPPPAGRVAASRISGPPLPGIRVHTTVASPCALTATSCSEPLNCDAFERTGDALTAGSQPDAEALSAVAAIVPASKTSSTATRSPLSVNTGYFRTPAVPLSSLRRRDVRTYETGMCRSMIRPKSVPAGKVPNALPQSPDRREAQKASATAGSP